ncbi:MAG: glutathionylspermidine synthase family protein [Verrucomicrobia bacterium]|nr:glutathionylspermidine synthase family protein [Verrucomicrobiota bacterium]
MQRRIISGRSNWREKVEEVGLIYHTHEGGPYWDESVYYELTAREVNELEAATTTLHELCIEAAGAVIKNEWWDRLAIPPAAIPTIRNSWERDDFSLYGRFDVAYDGHGPPKLLEYNADTPTALLEASVAQWFWLQDCFRTADQFNSIHERLIEAWKQLTGERVHFSSVKDHPEDEQTVLYLQDTAQQAGLVTKRTFIEDLGWNEKRGSFVDQDDQKITTAFKLYPWEWMWEDEFGRHLSREPARFVEPAWKMLLSNKGILPILWELFPNHPNLLPCYDRPEALRQDYVQKPKLGREGANATLVQGGQIVEATQGDYGQEGFVYQAIAPLANFDGHHPVLGLWVIHHEAAGLGIREDTRRIIGNVSRFVPHLF